LVGVLDGVEIAPADAARERLDENLTISRFRSRYIVDDKRVIPQYSCAHQVPS
jgi:hypothetical protein